MNLAYFNNTKKVSLISFSLLAVLLCAACSKDESSAPADSASKAAATPITPQATGLVKNPVKLSDTADALKWMDMASTKSPAQIAREEKAAKDAKAAADAKEAQNARLIAEAKQAADAKEAREAKLAAEAKAAADARAKEARAKEVQRAEAAAAAAAAAAKIAPVATQEPVLRVISKEQPKYPRNAAADGVTSGSVTAQVVIETDGRVSKVDIIRATPRKYFDKAVIAAAMQWKYAPISKQTTTTLEFNFNLDSDGS